MHIIPSIFALTPEEFITYLTAIGSAAPVVQIDIADGQFVTTTTAATPELTAQNLHTNCELHLMVQDPKAVISAWSNVSQVIRVLFPVESTEPIAPIIAQIKALGWEAGLTINPETAAAAVEPYVTDITTVMFMGVHPGAQGQPIIPEVLLKVAAFKTNHPNLRVSLDGGVNVNTLPQIVNTGLDVVCPGSAIFASGQAQENMQQMQNLLNTLEK